MSQAIAIANYLLARDHEARARGERPPPMSPMKALKLAYYAHGWYLGLTGRPLVTDEQVEAWDWGPVFPSLYHAAKRFGNGPIEESLRETDWGRPIGPVATLDREFDDSADVATWLDRVFTLMGDQDAIALSNSTHLPGSPWDVIYNVENNGHPPRGTDIPLALIRAYFQRWSQDERPPNLRPAQAG